MHALTLSEAVRLVVADVRESYPDESVAGAIEHARDTLRLPEEAPVAGAWPLEEDGSHLSAAYRLILSADVVDLRANLHAATLEA